MRTLNIWASQICGLQAKSLEPICCTWITDVSFLQSFSIELVCILWLRLLFTRSLSLLERVKAMTKSWQCNQIYIDKGARCSIKTSAFAGWANYQLAPLYAHTCQKRNTLKGFVVILCTLQCLVPQAQLTMKAEVACSVISYKILKVHASEHQCFHYYMITKAGDSDNPIHVFQYGVYSWCGIRFLGGFSTVRSRVHEHHSPHGLTELQSGNTWYNIAEARLIKFWSSIHLTESVSAHISSIKMRTLGKTWGQDASRQKQ